MTWDEARLIADELEESIAGDSELQRLRDALVLRAVRYARIRTDWRLAERSDRSAMGQARTAAHEALIDACNVLSRRMAGKTRDNRWRAGLGADRLGIGDFTCYLHCRLGLEAR